MIKFFITTMRNFQYDNENSFVIAVISKKEWDKLELYHQEIMEDETDLLIVLKETAKVDSLVKGLYGLMKQNLLWLIIDCPKEIEEVAYHTCTGTNNFRLIY